MNEGRKGRERDREIEAGERRREGEREGRRKRERGREIYR